jgi:hypothetical protein
MYSHAFNLSFVLHHHHVYESGISSKTMIPCPVLAIREDLCYFPCGFTFNSYTQKSQKYWLLIPFGFVNLKVVCV